MSIGLLVATRKGAWILKADGARRRWALTGPIFLGHIVHHMVQDPRDRRTLLMAARTGHLGPTVFRSTDAGASWKEAARPPAFPKATEGAGRVVDHVFWLEPGHASE
ncbi:MAG: sialidase family protein, partial [Candidatus Limnocylindria bacterium]